METCCAHTPHWHWDETGILVWTDSMCAPCARAYTRHFWMNYVNQALN